MKILPGHQAEIGYWLDQKSEGHGIISRSTLALARYGFESMKLQRIEIRCRVNNTKSRRVPERLSFTLEGILRDSEFFLGKYYDLALYSLLKTDKIAKQA
jgi:ribosomal-protein-serine acetyltransferase